MCDNARCDRHASTLILEHEQQGGIQAALTIAEQILALGSLDKLQGRGSQIALLRGPNPTSVLNSIFVIFIEAVLYRLL